jgi:putative DNA primase/helicase
VFKDFKLKKMLRSFFDKFEPNVWRSAIQTTYLSTLAFECPDADDLKSAENYINVKNGLLDLNSEEVTLLPHDKDVFCTTQIPIVYDSEAPCPNFRKFLWTVLKKDKELRMLVQEIMGYCLSNSVRAHKMFIFVGDGSNGKSVLCEIMTALAGGIENVSNVALKDFSHKFALSQIADKTLNISTENEMDSNLDTQLLKAIASGEPIQMEEKFQSPFSYRPYAKLVFAMNNLPYVKDKSYGFERRLVVIPFDMVFVDNPKTENEAERNPDLLDELNKELDGILAFAIRGLKRLKKNNFVFTRSKTAERALEAYKEKIDPMLAFVRDFVSEDEEAEPLNMTALREHFRKWCNREGHTNMAKIAGNTFWGLLKKVLDKERINYTKKEKGSRDLRGVTVKGLNDKKTAKTPDDLDDIFND